ncbi:MAG TPA: hypothetical protein DIV79_16650 [Opitutae bacterium]|nr:hypothetical protein [Opitutaceae bacterium]HCR31635.1 hypothetical protein [Opitutae bacterium]
MHPYPPLLLRHFRFASSSMPPARPALVLITSCALNRFHILILLFPCFIMKELEELGNRIRRYRIQLGIKQKDLAAKAAVSADVISSLENGRSIATASLARILRALGLRDALAEMLPAPTVSPLDLEKLEGKQRQRVR